MTLEEIRSKALELAEPEFKKFEPIALANTKKVLEAFKECQVSDYHFTGTTGYGYNDVGREKLDEVFAYVFKGEKAIVRPHFVSGTHALATTLISLMGNSSKGTEFIYAVGAPYDTMQSVIGASREVRGSLVEKGFTYTEVPLKDNTYDVEAIANAVNDNTRVVVIQRSRGYSTREPLSIADIKIIVDAVKAKNSNTICFVDNCYGEFLDTKEPTDVGADVMAGSLIKNPGGGLALTGGYIAGRKDLIELISYRMTSPGIGKECGLTFGTTRNVLQGFFLAPYIVSQAVMGAIFCSRAFEKLGYDVLPKYDDLRSDIIQCIRLNNADEVISFCEGIQEAAPVDSYVKPVPWDMPGYESEVIMAAGAFIQGSSIELSADAPIRPPYNVYFQGGLTFDHSKMGTLKAIEFIKKLKK